MTDNNVIIDNESEDNENKNNVIIDNESEDNENKNKVIEVEVLKFNNFDVYTTIFYLLLLSLIPVYYFSIIFGAVVVILATNLLIQNKKSKILNITKKFLYKKFLIAIVEFLYGGVQKIKCFSGKEFSYYDNKIIMFLINFFILILSLLMILPIKYFSIIILVILIILLFGLLNKNSKLIYFSLTVALLTVLFFIFFTNISLKLDVIFNVKNLIK